MLYITCDYKNTVFPQSINERPQILAAINYCATNRQWPQCSIPQTPLWTPRSGWCLQIIMLQHRAEVQRESLIISHWFATKRYIHGTSNQFPHFLLSVASQVAHPLCLRKCQTSINSYYIQPTICSPLFPFPSTTVWVCQGRSYTKQGRRLFHSALS